MESCPRVLVDGSRYAACLSGEALLDILQISYCGIRGPTECAVRNFRSIGQTIGRALTFADMRHHLKRANGREPASIDGVLIVGVDGA